MQLEMGIVCYEIVEMSKIKVVCIG